MSKGKFAQKGRQKHRTFGSKTLVLVMALLLLVGGAVGDTVAWLTAQTDQVHNEFTTSDITIELKEHTYDPEKDALTTEETTKGVNNYKMIPGWTIPKDPWVTVKANSEDCWVFIEVKETGGNVTVGTTTYSFDSFIDYEIDGAKWTQGDGTNIPENVYYCCVQDITADRKIEVLKAGKYIDDSAIEYTWANNQVLTKPEVTKEMMAAVTDTTRPTLSFAAYAVQLWKSNGAATEQISTARFSAEDAWKKTPGYTSGN